MQWLKRAALIIILLIVALATLDFMLENQSEVTLQFLDAQSPALPLSLFIVIAFILGSLLGILVGWLVTTRLRLRLRAQNNELNRYRKEIDQLRTPTIQG